VDRGFNKGGKPVGKRHYRVTYTMVIKVVDRDLRCELRLVKRRISIGLT
jgi:hypothetical protein